MTPWWVYVLVGRRGRTYVGSTNDLVRRERQHNGHLKGGAKATRGHRPWRCAAVYGPYDSRGDAAKAEWWLKHRKRGRARLAWTPEDSKWCWGLGTDHPWVWAPEWWSS